MGGLAERIGPQALRLRALLIVLALFSSFKI